MTAELISLATKGENITNWNIALGDVPDFTKNITFNSLITRQLAAI